MRHRNNSRKLMSLPAILCVCVCVLYRRAEQCNLFVATAIWADITTGRSHGMCTAPLPPLSNAHTLAHRTHAHTHSSRSYIQSATVILCHETESAGRPLDWALCVWECVYVCSMQFHGCEVSLAQTSSRMRCTSCKLRKRRWRSVCGECRDMGKATEMRHFNSRANWAGKTMELLL